MTREEAVQMIVELLLDSGLDDDDAEEVADAIVERLLDEGAFKADTEEM